MKNFLDSIAQRFQTKEGKLTLTILRRTLLCLLTLILVLVIGLVLICNLIFNGPSPYARNVLTMSMLESSGMKWFPGLFIGSEMVDKIQENVETPDLSGITIQEPAYVPPLVLENNEWEDHPDGIRIEYISGDTYNAYVMLIKDPSAVYMATSTEKFSTSIPGTRINQEIVKQGALAAINAGAFYDNGTSDPIVGSVPQGLVVAGGKVVWNSGSAPEQGFVGFNNNDKLVVAKTMTASQAMELGIRDGCCFGPVLIMNGQPNMEAYNSNSGWNPRTAIGQRADGAVIFLCIDGRQAGSIGGSYRDVIDIMTEYGAVNACNLDGGSSTVMMYKDTVGKMGEKDQVHMINSYSVLQKEPRRMPNFFMVRPNSED